MAASAVRLAFTDVTPNVIPSTATTSSVEARKIFAVSPNAGLIALASRVGGVVPSVLVAMGLPLVAAGVQRDLQIRLPISGRHVCDHLGGDALVPHVQAIAPGRQDRKSTRLNSSHITISYAVFCLKKKNEAPILDVPGEAVLGRVVAHPRDRPLV